MPSRAELLALARNLGVLHAVVAGGAFSQRQARHVIKGNTEKSSTTKNKRVVSGMRPTGRLHIGHYFGALENWVRLQNDPAYECFYFIADWHALTSDYADTSQ